MKSIFRRVALLSAVILILASCGGEKTLVIPHAVSSADAISLKDLNLKRGDYEVLSTVSESATVACTYKSAEIIINGVDDGFMYKFKFDKNNGWKLDSYSGIVTFGYFVSDLTKEMSNVPNPEEFSRRLAAARLINAVKDYDADGIIEPVTTTMVSQNGKNTVEFTTKVSAKLVKIKTN